MKIGLLLYQRVGGNDLAVGEGRADAGGSPRGSMRREESWRPGSRHLPRDAGHPKGIISPNLIRDF